MEDWVTSDCGQVVPFVIQYMHITQGGKKKLNFSLMFPHIWRKHFHLLSLAKQLETGPASLALPEYNRFCL